MSQSLPHVTALAIQTLDGFIARNSNHSTLDWRSESDATFFTDYLNNLGTAGVIVVGNTTYQLMLERLSKRNCIVFTRSIPTVQRVGEKLLLVNPKDVSLSAIFQGYDKVALLGGAKTYAYFLEHNLIHEILLTTELVRFARGLRFFDPPERLNEMFRLDSVLSLNQEGTTLSHYYRKLK